MANKDFFDEEYDKIKKTNEEDNRQSDSDSQFQRWYAHDTQPQVSTRSNKPLYIALICVGLALCLALGWVLCAIFGGNGNLSKGEEQKYLNSILTSLRDSGLEISDAQWETALQDVNKQVESGKIEAEALLGVVFKTLHDNYYQDISQDKWYEAVESAGTALMQAAGDQFCRLMSPQTYYNYLNPVSTVASSNGKVFGVSFQVVQGVGLYVSSVVVNSSAYGKLEAYDIVYKMSNVKNNNGRPLVINGTTFDEIVTSEWESESFMQILAQVNSATFHVLRGGEVLQFDLVRGELGYVNSDYPFEFVEFYFGDDCTNVSTSKVGNANISTKDERLLGNLSKLKDTGYVRIVEFMDTITNGNERAQADKEFETVMKLFKSRGLKHLILDLKGNPGGRVDYVCNIAGMLVTDAKLSADQKSVVSSAGKLLITTLKIRNDSDETYTSSSSYAKYFDDPTSKCDIVVWTDGGSASASELLTGALLDYGTAIQMGTRTYGKGIAQTCQPLKDYTGTVITNDNRQATEHWAIYYTVAAYYSPLGINIHGKGYTPASKYNNLDTYEKLWTNTIEYFGSDGVGEGILTNAA